jgi:hypothetical protein
MMGVLHHRRRCEQVRLGNSADITARAIVSMLLTHWETRIAPTLGTFIAYPYSLHLPHSA